MLLIAPPRNVKRSSDIPYPSACHRRHFSRDDQYNEVANTEHLDIHNAGRPVVRDVRISLEQANSKHGMFVFPERQQP
jgi:hypothetical protein